MPDSLDRPATRAAPVSELPVPPLDIAGRALLEDRGLGWRAELLQPGLLGLRSSRGRVALLAADADRPSRLPPGLDGVLQGTFPARYVVVLGGDDVLRERLAALAHEFAVRRIWVHHALGDSAWQNRAPRWLEQPVARALAASAARALEPEHWSRDAAVAHARRLELDVVLSRGEAREVEQFYALLNRRKPLATLVLLGVILAVFGLQAMWGGTDLPPLLARMGSLVPGRVHAGQWWRFFSCTFLHGGALHVALNALLLTMLGRSLERFIGPTRFALIYFAAGLAGSVASSLFVTSQSVGASGAIWGLFGAEAALAFYPRPLLPPALIGVWRRTTLVYLGLNLANSFNPQVDLAAHLGGGVMGAGVLALLAASGQLSPHGRVAKTAGTGLRAVTLLLAASFVIGLGVAIAAGRPWQLDAAPELERVPLPGSAWSAEIPRDRSPIVDAARATAIGFGNLAYDPSVVDISWVPSSNGPSPTTEWDELTAIARQLAVAAGPERLVPPRVERDAAHPERSLVVARYRFSSDPLLVDDRAIGIIDGARVDVHVIAWEALPQSFEGLAPRILKSFGAASLAGGPALRSVFHSGFRSPSQVGESRATASMQALEKYRSVPFPDGVTVDLTLAQAPERGADATADVAGIGTFVSSDRREWLTRVTLPRRVASCRQKRCPVAFLSKDVGNLVKRQSAL